LTVRSILMTHVCSSLCASLVVRILVEFTHHRFLLRSACSTTLRPVFPHTIMHRAPRYTCSRRKTNIMLAGHTPSAPSVFQGVRVVFKLAVFMSSVCDWSHPWKAVFFLARFNRRTRAPALGAVIRPSWSWCLLDDGGNDGERQSRFMEITCTGVRRTRSLALNVSTVTVPRRPRRNGGYCSWCSPLDSPLALLLVRSKSHLRHSSPVLVRM